MKIHSAMLLSILSIYSHCFNNNLKNTHAANTSTRAEKIVGDIAPPEEYSIELNSAFANYLQRIRLKSDKKVYLFNGQLKLNQDAQYAVLDVSVGDKDLQQCADAVMRLRAAFLYQEKRFDEIGFYAVNGTRLDYASWLSGVRYKSNGNSLKSYIVPAQVNSSSQFAKYLEFVFSYCGTASLGKSLAKKKLEQIQTGDVFLKPGYPGHAVIVMATAQKANGTTVYLLAQSYMPAQSIHILKNPTNSSLSPWYEAKDGNIITPEWIFYENQLYEWKE